MDDTHFDAYVDQIIAAAKTEDPKERVAILLGEFREKSYLEGRHMMIDGLRRELNGYDDRIDFVRDPKPARS
jgi:hypothetical protein